jgi:hypothetical protein
MPAESAASGPIVDAHPLRVMFEQLLIRDEQHFTLRPIEG